MYNSVIVVTISLVAVSIVVLLLAQLFRQKKEIKPLSLRLGSVRRAHNNPVLSPLGHNDWEACGVFNPGAYADDTGTVHLVYRAVGSDGVSRIGYAKSVDGKTFDERHSYPIFFVENVRGLPMYRYDPVRFPSGGSWGGAEDPRLVRIDDMLYLTFNAFDGWDFIRIGVTSIKEKDFVAGKWDWKKSVLISPEGEIHKNWVLFPEKINGKFAILHSISPHVQIDLVDSFDDLVKGKKKIKSVFNRQEQETWDTWLRGVGCPPLKTNKGWLIFYHAVERHEPNKYKIGVLLLDLKDPTKIIARSPAPLIAPECWYENDGMPGIVYVCGAVIRDDELYIYYGGGDKHTCVAHVPLHDVLNWLVSTEKNRTRKKSRVY